MGSQIPELCQDALQRPDGPNQSEVIYIPGIAECLHEAEPQLQDQEGLYHPLLVHSTRK